MSKRCTVVVLGIFVVTGVHAQEHSTPSGEVEAAGPAASGSLPAEPAATAAEAAEEEAGAAEDDAAADAAATAAAAEQATGPDGAFGASTAPLPPVDVTAGAAPVAGEPRWSLGGGVGLASWGGGTELYGTAVASGISGGTGASLLYPLLYSYPEPRLFLEYQLLEQLALLAQARASFGYLRRDNYPAGFLAPEARYDYGAGVAAGARYIMNPGGLVELSFLGALSADYLGRREVYIIESFTSAGAAEETKTVAYSNLVDVGLQVGLALERELIEGVWLRLQSSLVRAALNFGLVESEVTGPNGDTTTTAADERPWQLGADVGVALSPSLELRMQF